MQAKISKMNKDPFREETLDIKKLLFKYLRYWYWFVICVGFALTVAYFYNKFSQTVYRTDATLLIRDDRKGGFRPGQVMGELDMFYQRNNVINEMALLRSFSMVDSALQAMDVGVTYYNIGRLVGEIRMSELYQNTPFYVEWDRTASPPYNTPVHVKVLSENTYEMEINPQKRFSLFSKEGVKHTLEFGEVFDAGNYRMRLVKSDLFRPASNVGREYIFIINQQSTLTRQYLSNLNVSPLDDEVSIIRLSFQSTHPDRGIDFLNNLSEVYLRQNLIDKNTIAQNTIDFIDQQIGIISDSLHMAQSTLEEFRQDKQLMDVGMVSTRLFSDLSQLDNQKSLENIKRSYYEYMLDYIEKDEDFTNVFSPSVLGIEEGLLNQLIGELIALHSEKARHERISKEMNPAIQRINQEIEQTKSVLEDKLHSLIEASDILMKEINDRITRVENRFEQLPGTDRQFLNIQRRVSLSDATYNYLMEKRAEAGIAMASNVPDHKIVDRARSTGVVAPNTQRNYTFAFILGLGAPLVVLVLFNFFDNRIHEKKEVTDIVDFPVLGVIPHNSYAGKKEDLNLVVFKQNNSPVTEAFRAMRTNLQYFATQSQNKMITISSTRDREGKTFTAINLASVIALAGKRTVIVGADLRKPKIFQDFKILKSPGLSNYLAGTANKEEIIQKTAESPELFVISSGPTPPNPSELLEGERMSVLLQELRAEFDFIIIDTPPVGIVPDGINLIKKSDIALFIVRQKYSTKASLEFLNEFSEKIGVKNICIEINDVSLRGPGYGLGYGYGYGYHSYYGTSDKSDGNMFKKWYQLVSKSLKKQKA